MLWGFYRSAQPGLRQINNVVCVLLLGKESTIFWGIMGYESCTKCFCRAQQLVRHHCSIINLGVTVKKQKVRVFVILSDLQILVSCVFSIKVTWCFLLKQLPLWGSLLPTVLLDSARLTKLSLWNLVFLHFCALRHYPQVLFLCADTSVTTPTCYCVNNRFGCESGLKTSDVVTALCQEGVGFGTMIINHTQDIHQLLLITKQIYNSVVLVSGRN